MNMIECLQSKIEEQAREIERLKRAAQVNWNQFSEGMKAQPASGGDDAERAAFEAVAWRVTGRDGLTVTAQYPKWAEADCLLTITPLYTHPAATVPATSRVVPVELLRDLLDEGPRAATWAAQDKIRALLEVKP